ncbi:hypothetical protein SAMN05443639_102743, partial [Stigmatella erecta]
MGIKLGGVGKLFKGGGKIPDFKPSAPKPQAPKPDAKPTFTPRPDINGKPQSNKPDFKPQAPKPDTKPTFTPRPDINGKPQLNKPDFNLDSLKPG